MYQLRQYSDAKHQRRVKERVNKCKQFNRDVKRCKEMKLQALLSRRDEMCGKTRPGNKIRCRSKFPMEQLIEKSTFSEAELNR